MAYNNITFYNFTETCSKRQDDWQSTVLGRLESVQDVPAVVAKQHWSPVAVSSVFH